MPRPRVALSTPSSDTVVLRPAESRDARRIAALSEQLGYPATPTAIDERLKLVCGNPDQMIMVADRAGEVIGWSHVMLLMHLESGSFAEIVGLVVDEKHRASGIGKRLLRAAEKWALQRGITTVVVRTNIMRTETHKFYEHVGYPLLKKQMVEKKELG